MRRNRREKKKTSFCTFGQTLLFFLLSHDVSLEDSFEGSERFPFHPKMVQQRGNSNYWQIYTVGGRPNIISCIVAVQVQDKVYVV